MSKLTLFIAFYFHQEAMPLAEWFVNFSVNIGVVVSTLEVSSAMLLYVDGMVAFRFQVR